MTPAERAAKIAELRAQADRLEREGKRDPVSMLMNARAGYGLILSAMARGFELSYAMGVANEAIKSIDSAIKDLLELTIKTPDAPAALEPTGAELVGKVCDHRDDESREWFSSGHKVESYDPSRPLPYLSSSGMHWKFARLAKEQP